MQKLVAQIPVPIQVAFKYGFFAALLLAAVFIGLFYIDRHPLLIPVVYDVRVLILAIFIFFGVKEFRDYRNNRLLSFWQGMLIGLILSVTVGFLMYITIMAFGAVNETLLSGYLGEMAVQLNENRERFLEAIGEEAYQDALKNLPSTTLGDLAVDYYLKSVAIGLFFTVIISIILRRQQKA